MFKILESEGIMFTFENIQISYVYDFKFLHSLILNINQFVK